VSIVAGQCAGFITYRLEPGRPGGYWTKLWLILSERCRGSRCFAALMHNVRSPEFIYCSVPLSLFQFSGSSTCCTYVRLHKAFFAAVRGFLAHLVGFREAFEFFTAVWGFLAYLVGIWEAFKFFTAVWGFLPYLVCLREAFELFTAVWGFLPYLACLRKAFVVAFRNFCEQRLLAWSRLSVCSSVCTAECSNSSSTGGIFIKRDIRLFFEKSVEKIQV
jgi:hypothetical protein